MAALKVTKFDNDVAGNNDRGIKTKLKSELKSDFYTGAKIGFKNRASDRKKNSNSDRTNDRNSDRANAKLNSLTLLAVAVLNSTLAADASAETIATESQVVVAEVPLTPLLMHAKSFDSKQPIGQFLVSEKLDGVRAYWDGLQLVSRAGNVINAPNWFTESFPPIPLDGELWIARGQFERVSGIVRSKNRDDDWSLVRFMVFDLPKERSSFIERYEKIKQLIERYGNKNLGYVSQGEVASVNELMDLLVTTELKGGEGLMLHKMNSLYEAKRSSNIQKLKSFQDAEAVVVAHIEGKGKYARLTGAIEVINKDGIRFKIGSGFTLQQRRNPPAIGSQITYRFRGKTNKGTPRFATYVRAYSL